MGGDESNNKIIFFEFEFRGLNAKYRSNEGCKEDKVQNESVGIKMRNHGLQLCM